MIIKYNYKNNLPFGLFSLNHRFNPKFITSQINCPKNIFIVAISLLAKIIEIYDTISAKGDNVMKANIKDIGSLELYSTKVNANGTKVWWFDDVIIING